MNGFCVCTMDNPRALASTDTKAIGNSEMSPNDPVCASTCNIRSQVTTLPLSSVAETYIDPIQPHSSGFN